MKYKLNPFKITTLIIYISFFIYLSIILVKFEKERNLKTENFIKNIKIRKKDFYLKESIGLMEPVANSVENIDESVQPSLENTQIQEQNTTSQPIESQGPLQDETQTKKVEQKIKKQYIQVATIEDGKKANEIVKKLGASFRVSKTKNSKGKILYRIYSVTVETKEALTSQENQIKAILGGSQNYVIRDSK